MKVVFLGSADFGIPALSMLHEKHEICAVVSTPPRRKGRGLKTVLSPVMEFTQKNLPGVPYLMPDRLDDPLFIEALHQYSADCFVVVAFKLLPRSVFAMPPYGTVNIHASLLPRYRGPAPIHRAIEAGEKITGVTIFRIDEGIDTGEILVQEQLAIGDQETTPELYERLSRLGTTCLDRALIQLEQQNSHPLPQDTGAVSKAPKLRKEEARIDWSLSADAIFNRIRAFKPFPGSFTVHLGKRLGIDWAVPVEAEACESIEAGTIRVVGGEYFDVQTGSGLLRIISVKPEGRKCMSVHDFLNGTTLRKGMKLIE